MVISGVIRPPPEIRAVADRTALYVAKNGRAFEERILNSERGKTPKFAFLTRSSPFHAYYEDRIQFYENGGEDTKEGESTAPDSTKEAVKNEIKEKEEVAQIKRKQEQAKKASVIDPVAKALLVQRSKIAQFRTLQDNTQQKTNEESDVTSTNLPDVVAIPPPPPFHLINIAAPASLSPAQIESIQLVAQFVALDGKGGSFLPQLTYREWNNPAFAFCQPRHGHFPYFSALVDAYRRILSIWTSTDSIKNNSVDQVKLMANNVDYCLEASAYRAEYELEKERVARKTDDSGLSEGFGKIDWHDFVVVETIDFAADEVVEQAMLPPPPPPPIATMSNYVSNFPDGDTMVESDEEEEETIRVVPSYTPRIVATHETRVETVIDPITGKSVPVKDMPEHLRIQLLDPKWAEERKKFQEKQKDSNLVSGDVVASNLERFAQARGDRFGKKEPDTATREAESKKRLDDANRVIHNQAQSSSAIGPSLPIQPTPYPVSMGELPSKRARIEPQMGHLNPVNSIFPPPPPPPSQQTMAGMPVSNPSIQMVDPFATAAFGGSDLAPPISTPVSSADLLSEADFLATLTESVVPIQIRIPNDPTQMAWNFYGQIVTVSVDVKSDVKALKVDIASTHLNNIAANKIQLKNPATGLFLKDAVTLAALNIGPSTTLELVPRARGGKKK